ncbi:hypothetical protein PCASD_09621 [Puccinia coronata f. sp. avenae]|uniref:Retrotransposon gag domain-containing protein n=2 Tax=Puccinia coronata f. sp. avenae TaxID=200324 RepID=A0A2N5UPM8_9BASI|nr:hypothetical protein PCASD_09621 [Puccinia coronata f. sp. avenae]
MLDHDSSPTNPTRMPFPGSQPRSQSHPLISPFNSPNPNIHVFSEDDHRSLPPLSPQHPDFQSQPIPSPLLSPASGARSPCMTSHQEEGVSNQMSGLQFENPDQDQTLLSHSQSITTLESQARRTEAILRRNEDTIQESQQLLVFASDVNKMKAQFPWDLQVVRDTVNGALNGLQLRVGHLETRQKVSAPAKIFPEPPFYAHIYFSGDIAETHRFCCLIRDTFARIPGHFASKRQRILWIAGYFRTASGNLGSDCPSYTWWRGLLTKNAHKQGLPTQKALSMADFVIDKLFDLELFLSAIEDMFSNHKEAEEHCKALFLLRQGNKSMAEFKIQFNTLLYTVILSEESKCEVYEAAINPKIVELGVNCGGWTELDTLVNKQRMAVKLAIDVNCVAQINQRKFQAPLPCIEFKRAPVAFVPVPTKSTATPMDIDLVLADLGFTFANWRRECTDCNLCFRCMKPFDKTHVDVWGCPHSDDKWLVKSDILKVWKSWGGLYARIANQQLRQAIKARNASQYLKFENNCLSNVV